jgi:hypothetical protein
MEERHDARFLVVVQAILPCETGDECARDEKRREMLP